MKGLGTCLLNFLQKRPPHSKRKPISSPPFFRLFPDGFTIFFSDFPKKPFPFFPSFLFDYHPWLVNPHPSSSSVWSASQSLLSLLLLHYLTSPFFPIKKHFGSTRFFLKGILKKKIQFLSLLWVLVSAINPPPPLHHLHKSDPLIVVYELEPVSKQYREIGRTETIKYY